MTPLDIPSIECYAVAVREGAIASLFPLHLLRRTPWVTGTKYRAQTRASKVNDSKIEARAVRVKITVVEVL